MLSRSKSSKDHRDNTAGPHGSQITKAYVLLTSSHARNNTCSKNWALIKPKFNAQKIPMRVNKKVCLIVYWTLVGNHFH